MRRYRLPELAFLICACSSHAQAPAPTQPEDAKRAAVVVDDADKRTPMRSMPSEDAVRAWAKGGVVSRWNGPTIEGFELFFVTHSDGEKETGQGVVVSDGKIATGQEALRAVIASGSKDAVALAAYASYLLQRGADPLRDDHTVSAPPAEKALIRPPSISGTTLEYWIYQGQFGAPKLARTQLDLGSLAVTVTPAERAAAAPQDAVETARAKLDRSAYDQKAGAEELGTLCSDPRVPPILAASLASHKVPDTRAALAKAMAGCKDAASVKALIAALGDAHGPVRKWAAESLGAISDASARAPLERALGHERDPDAQVSIQRAVAKLSGGRGTP
jgi:hypothetical protein